MSTDTLMVFYSDLLLQNQKCANFEHAQFNHTMFPENDDRFEADLFTAVSNVGRTSIVGSLKMSNTWFVTFICFL